MMRRLGSDGLLAITLAGIIVLLAATVAWQIAAGGMHSGNDLVPPSETAAIPELPDIFSLSELTLDTYSEIAERPVFSPSRRPATGPARTSIPTPALNRSADLELVGLVSEGDRRLALIRPRGSQETVQLAEGETYRDWTVAQIGVDFVVVRSGAGEQELRLAYKPR
jgi:hypothetical protein